MDPGCDGVVGADAVLAFLGEHSHVGSKQLPQLGLVSVRAAEIPTGDLYLRW